MRKQTGPGSQIGGRGQRARIRGEWHDVVSAVAAAVVFDCFEGQTDRLADRSDQVEVSEGEEVVR